MNVRAYEVLELDKIRERLASFAETERGRASALSLEPVTDPNRITTMLEETSEARRLADENETLTLRELPDIDPLLETLSVEGRSLDVSDFTSLARLRRSRKLAGSDSTHGKTSYRGSSSWPGRCRLCTHSRPKSIASSTPSKVRSKTMRAPISPSCGLRRHDSRRSSKNFSTRRSPPERT